MVRRRIFWSDALVNWSDALVTNKKAAISNSPYAIFEILARVAGKSV